MRCVACGALSPEQVRFCANCGTAQSVSGPAGSAEQRRLVSIVFCDLVGSTSLAGRLDPEVLRSVTLGYFDLMRDCVEAHGGVVEKFIGDAVMAAFGIPVLHEDDARRALAAAYDMVAALADFNVELEAGLGIRLDVRIGVNTGEVVTTPDTSAGHGFVSGETVNVAARLEQNAAPGQILVGPQTVRAAGGVAVVEPAGDLVLRGKSQPVTAYVLLGVLSDEPEVVRRFDLPFVGRAPELAELTLVLDRLHRQGEGQLMSVFGDAGIGKTRLVRTWLANGASGVRSGTGRCRPYGAAGTLAPLAEAITTLTHAGGAAEIPSVLRDGLLRDGTPNPSVAETVAAVSELLAAQAPVVLVLDDCHWAAPALLDVLDDIIDRTDQAPVLFVCLARPELMETRPGWGGGRLNMNSMVLQPLARPEAELLAAGLVEVGAHADGVLARAVERAGGNPLHLEQVVTALLQDGGSEALPASVHALLAARIGALSPPERAVLELAAVIGRDFDARTVRELAGAELDDPGPVLRDLRRRRLVEGAGPGGRFRFSSALIQEVAYVGTPKRIRAQRHERVADQLPAENLASSAGHLEAAYRLRAELGLVDTATADLRRRAGAALTTAGTLALARADLTWAVDLLGRAHDLARPGEPGQNTAARHLGEVLLALGRIPEGTALLGEVLEDPLTDPVTAAHARLLLSAHAPEGNPGEAARAALAVFEAAGDRLGVARAKIRLAQEQQFHGRHEQALDLLGQGLAEAVSLGAEADRALALGAIGVSLWLGPEPLGSAVQQCRALLAEHGGRAAQVTLSCTQAVLLGLQGRPAEARDHMARAETGARELGYAEADVVLPQFAAQIEIAAGNRDEAERLIRKAREAARTLGSPVLVESASRDLARTLLLRSAWPEAAAVLGEVPVDSPADLPPAEAADDAGLRARVLARSGGRRDEALTWADRAVAIASGTDSPWSRGFAEFDRADTLLVLGRPGAADATRSAERWFARKELRAAPYDVEGGPR
ncbi:adenylate/guanylate cyclase domain-containing protein [Kineosporia sp. NBRC 101731]|uniref:adenylate/guanylate cyclase domain-containing protein n=1 Tax=Kineosporia sp. NBRC 101731 TaxID=3032199 RepID=UPI0024A471EF|nr:adenylate/guanylate cyclase domain-containing protein [Kineosporia sp. NBRC 101731]GLY29774.1 guanylate cyclase [Kineosporia sp. NBRC 101731]